MHHLSLKTAPKHVSFIFNFFYVKKHSQWEGTSGNIPPGRDMSPLTLDTLRSFVQ